MQGQEAFRRLLSPAACGKSYTEVRKKMKKIIGLILLTVALLALPLSAMAGCQCVQPTYGGQTGFEDATCTKDGYYVLECADCGGEYKEKAKNALGHDYQYAMTNPALCESDGKEWYECTRCGDTQYQTIPKLGHQWSLAGSLNATCAKDGANYYECTRLGCGEEKTESIPATGKHDWVLDNINRDDVECVAGGTAYYHCSVCMDQKNEPVNATGHNWQAVTATAATCQSAKVVTYKCSKCNDTKTETEGSKIDHSWVLTYSEPATCAADGYKSYKCGMCSETKTDVLPATEQCSWGDWIVATEATCTKDGLKVAQCSVCGDTKKETIPSEGVHDYRTQSSQAATCTQDGYKKYECSKCHKEKTETLKATGHNLGTATVITAATCTAEGKSEATCKTCGAKETSTIPKTAHSWGDWKVTKEATEAATGTKERTCKTCGAKDTETIPKKGVKPTATPKPTQKPSSSDKSNGQLAAEEGTILVYTTSGKVNTRSGPSKDNKRVQQIAKRNTCLGELLDAQADNKGVVWFKVEYKKKVCWVTSEFAKVVIGEPDSSIRQIDTDTTELKAYLFKSSDLVVEALEMEETSTQEVVIPEWINDAVYISGEPYVEQIVVFDEGYSLYDVEVGDKIKEVEKALKKQNLVLETKTADQYAYRVPVRTDALSADENGFCSSLCVIVGPDNTVTEIRLYSDTTEYHFMNE